MTQEFDYTCHAQLHIRFSDVLTHEQSEVLEDQLAFFLGALGYAGSIHSDTTWNTVSFPVDIEDEDDLINENVIDKALYDLVLASEKLQASAREQVSSFDREYWCSEEEENEDFAEDGFIRDIGDYIREEDESSLD